MRNTLTFFILGLACLLRAQQFNGYGTVSIITANPGSPFHEIVINGFVGGLQPGGAESYQPASIAVGDAVWLHCARFTVTATGNITPLYLEIVPDDINQPEPVEHEVAFICRETVAATGGLAAAPPVAVGAGGLPTDLAQCVTAYYAQAATTGAGEGLRKTAQRFAWGNAPGDTTRSIVTNRKLISQSPSGAGTVICPNDNGAFRVSAYPSPAALPLDGSGNYSFAGGGDIELNKDYFVLQVHDGDNAVVVNDSVAYFAKRIEYSESVVFTPATLVPKSYVDALDAADGDKSATNENQTVSAGTGISVVQTGQNFAVTNTGDTNAADDLTTSSTAGGDLSGSFSNLQIAANAVGTAEIANGTVASADMTTTVTAGSCTNCNVTFDGAGRATNFSNGSGGGGSGTVTSVDLSLPTDVFDVSGNPITTNGTFSVTFDAQTAKKFLASPTSATGTPTMRAIVADDLPTIPGSKISGDITGNAGSLTTGDKGDISSFGGVLAINANVIGTNQLSDAGVETSDIADEAVTTPKIAGGSVTGDKIADMAATDGQVLKWTTASGWAPGDFAVGSAEVTDNTLTSDDIADGSILPDDFSDMGASSGQVLKWNGSYWEPSADETASFGIISPAQITSRADNWNPTGLSSASLIRLSGNANFQMITGITAPAAAKRLTLNNVGAYSVLLTKEDGNSSAANRFALDRDFTLSPRQSIELYYDATESRWKSATSTSSAVGAGTYYEREVVLPQSATTGDYDDMTFGISGAGAGAGAGSATAANPGLSGSNIWPVYLNAYTGSTTSGAAAILGKNAIVRLDNTNGVNTAATFRAKISASHISNATNQHTLRVGFANTLSSTDTTSAGIYFRYRHWENSGQWVGVTRSAGGSESVLNSSVSQVVGTFLDLLICVRPDGTAAFFINDALVGVNSATNFPDNTNVGVQIKINKLAGTTSHYLNSFGFQYSVSLR